MLLEAAILLGKEMFPALEVILIAFCPRLLQILMTIFFPVTDDDVFNGPSGSGALAASSEADPWSSRTSGPWNVDPTSPNHSGNTSPARHRGSNASAATNSILSESQKTSPYLVSSRPAIGQGPGLTTRSVQKSNLDPASGPFKYPYGSLVFGENKENGSVHALNGGLDVQDGFIFDQRPGLGSAYRGTQSTTSREPSLPPSRRSETASSGATNGSIFSNGAYSAFGHTPQNSVHMQRPTLPSRAPSFGATANGRRLSTSTDRIQDAEIPYTHGNFLEKGLQVTFPESSMAATEQPLSSLGTYPGYDAAYRGNTRARDNQFAANGYPESAYSSQLNSGKVSRASDRETLSTFNDRRNQPMSPKYYNANGSATASELDNACTRAQQAQSFSDLDRNLQRLQLSQPQQSLYYGPHGIYTGQFQGQYPPQPWDFTSQQYRPASQGYVPYSVQLPSYTPVSVPRGPARDQDVGHGVRSILLEEFRNNTKSNTRRYDLKDIYGHVVEFSGDQHGSRFIQSKLETANSDEKDQIFREIQPNALQLMTDVFGNYVIQKLFEHGNQIQKKMFAEIMKNHVNELSLQMYGCRVVQKALEHVLADQQAELVKELQSDVLRYVKDQNGNHVVQKAIERCPTEHVQFVLDAFRGQVHTLATHPYGCRVIQRMLEYCSEKDQTSILEELFACAQMLIIDQYGNYVVQHVIQHGKPEDQTALIKMVTAQVLTLSKHKFASNVVERSIVCGSDEQRRAILVQITVLSSDGSSPLQLMMKDQYGNYVIRKFLSSRQCPLRTLPLTSNQRSY